MTSTIKVDTISENTSANGVAIDGVTIKDSVVLTDTISEKTSANGVTIDGLLIKDSAVGATGTATSVAGIPFYRGDGNNSLLIAVFILVKMYQAQMTQPNIM